MSEVEGQLRDLLDALGNAAPVIRWVTPQDVTTHRSLLMEHFLARPGDPYPHHFKYDPVDPTPVLDLCGRIRHLAPLVHEPAIRAALMSRAERVELRVRTIAARDDRAFSAASIRLGQLPTEATIAQARTILSKPADPTDGERLNTSDQLVSRMRTALINYGLANWNVVTDEHMAAGAVVNGAERSIRVRADLTPTKAQVNRLVVHEIGGHVLRWENARSQPYLLAATSLGGGVATEEGLAALLEEEQGVSDHAMLRTYAARVLAVEHSRTAGIMDVIEYLVSHDVRVEEAVAISLRVKRGLHNPNQPGGSTKDHAYLSGLLALRQLPAEDITLLRSTKWAMEHIALIRHLRRSGVLVPSSLVPDLHRLDVELVDD